MLPLPVQASQRFPVRALLGHCFYRRIIIWAVTVTFFLCLVLFSGGVRTHHGMIIDHFPEFGNNGHTKLSTSTSSYGELEKPKIIEQHPTHEHQAADPNGPHWLKYQQ